MDELRAALTLDAIVVVGCGLALYFAPMARLSHPGFLYLLVHVYIVSFRGWAILRGAPTFLGIDLNAVATAVYVADSFLVCATLGWLAAGSKVRSRTWATVDARWVDRVSLVAIPLGLVTLLFFGYVPGVGEGSGVVTTSYQIIAVLWPALALLALIYVRGFKPWLLVPFGLYVAVLALQGHSRFRVLIPVLLLLLMYLDSRGRRWPTMRLAVVGLVIAAVFIPLKQIGLAVRDGDASLSTVIETVQTSTREASRGSSAEQALLDQQAITVNLVDEGGYAFLGRPYLGLITLPVPRPLWPEKPALNDYAKELSTPRYPLAEVGGVTGLSGDLYLNFRWWGVTLGALAFGWISGRFFVRSYNAPIQSTSRFTYLLLAACMVQIARDGLISIVLFMLVNAMPWLVIAWLSSRSRPSRAGGLNVQTNRSSHG